MSNKKKLRYSKTSIICFILVSLLETKKVLKSDILSHGIVKQTMYKYIMEVKTSLADLQLYHLNVVSVGDYYYLM